MNHHLVDWTNPAAVLYALQRYLSVKSQRAVAMAILKQTDAPGERTIVGMLSKDTNERMQMLEDKYRLSVHDICAIGLTMYLNADTIAEQGSIYMKGNTRHGGEFIRVNLLEKPE
ncbi:MAG: hypothetical protein Q8R39_00260 [bacterium]|nr:hypothetical protein [bacterium]MDZ4284546.1 hypothetical protein [Patescibacteria group bacterium]